MMPIINIITYTSIGLSLALLLPIGIILGIVFAVKALQLSTERLIEKSWDNGESLCKQENTVGTVKLIRGAP
jgi:hypothetical protein